MIKIFIKLVILSILLSGCNYDLQGLQKDISSTSLDKSISETEFKEIYQKVLDSDDSKLEAFEDRKLLYDYMVLYLEKTDRNAKIWNPSPPVEIKPFNINVFLENSGSMNGYVEGVTDFENSIYDMLGNIKTNDLCDSLNLNFINNTVSYIKGNALAPDIEDFVEKLNPTTFSLHRSNLTNSDLSEVIKKVVSKTDDRNLSILISDFIFSPGSGAKAKDYLSTQKVSIRVNLSEKLNDHNLAIAIYQMQSNFDGFYSDQNNNVHKFVGNRPYYIWIFGNEQMISVFLKDQIINNTDTNILNKAVFTSTKNSGKTPVKIVKTDKTGDFKWKSPTEIEDAESENGTFSFSIAANFSENLRDKSYFSASENYITSNSDYEIKARALTTKELESASLQGFTHLLQLTTKKLVSGELSVKVISKIPQWAIKSSNTDDTNIMGNKLQQAQTFGLKALFEGVSGAFNSKPDINDNVISEFKIIIKTK